MADKQLDLVLRSSRRVALAATGIVAAAYLLIAAGVLLIVTHNLTSDIDQTLSRSLQQLQAQRSQPPGPDFNGPSGRSSFDLPVALWMYHPDGNYSDRNAAAEGVNLPVSYKTIKDPETININGTDLRVMGGLVGDDWAVVGQSMDSVYQARWNTVLAESFIGPVLLAIVFLGALTIGRRVAAPIEMARRRQMDFTANASHELRTPVAVIQAQSSLALSQPRDESWYRTAFERVAGEARRMQRLVDELLWLARLDATEARAKSDRVDLGAVVSQAVDRFMALAEARGQRLTLAVETGQHVINAPPEWIDQLVGVLVENACKYTPDFGSIALRVQNEGERVRLSVDDSGPGMPAQGQGQIFERFHRGTDQSSGSGLGLSIADAVVKATHGHWDIGESAAGGASMAVTWPRRAA